VTHRRQMELEATRSTVGRQVDDWCQKHCDTLFLITTVNTLCTSCSLRLRDSHSDDRAIDLACVDMDKSLHATRHDVVKSEVRSQESSQVSSKVVFPIIQKAGCIASGSLHTIPQPLKTARGSSHRWFCRCRTFGDHSFFHSCI